MEIYLWPLWRNLHFINKSNIYNVIFGIVITYIMYLMFWVKQPLPEWTELALILVYPTVMTILAERKNSSETHT